MLISTTIVGFIAYSLIKKPFDVLVSSNGRYKVELYEDRQLFFVSTVNAKIFDNEKLLAEDKLYTGDLLDGSFTSIYQKYVWVDDNIITFRGIENHQVANDRNGDSLVISNNTEREIRLLKIDFSINMFLVVNLAPHSHQTVYVNHSKALEWISARGEFSDGQKISFKGVNFTEKSKNNLNELFKYCVSIEEDKFLINSLQIEGYEDNPKIIIPKAKKCIQ